MTWTPRCPRCGSATHSDCGQPPLPPARPSIPGKYNPLLASREPRDFSALPRRPAGGVSKVVWTIPIANGPRLSLTLEIEKMKVLLTHHHELVNQGTTPFEVLAEALGFDFLRLLVVQVDQ